MGRSCSFNNAPASHRCSRFRGVSRSRNWVGATRAADSVEPSTTSLELSSLSSLFSPLNRRAFAAPDGVHPGDPTGARDRLAMAWDPAAPAPKGWSLHRLQALDQRLERMGSGWFLCVGCQHLALPQRSGHHVPARTSQCSGVLLTHHHQVHPHRGPQGRPQRLQCHLPVQRGQPCLGHHHQQIQIRIGPGLAPCPGAVAAGFSEGVQHQPQGCRIHTSGQHRCHRRWIHAGWRAAGWYQRRLGVSIALCAKDPRSVDLKRVQ